MAPVRAAAWALDRQRRHNRERIDEIIHRHVDPDRWPPDLARVYLRQRLSFAWTDEHCRGLEAFHERAAKYGLIERVRPLEMLETS